MKSPRLLFLLFLVITLVAFYPTIGAGFVFDFLGWQRQYDQGSFWDFLHSFGYKGNHQALHLFFYSFYALFHIKGLPWYLLFCTLHAANGWLLYTWLTSLNTRWSIHAHRLLILLVAILFLLHPYNVEPVVWKVCLHYLLSLASILGILLLAKNILDKPATRWYVLIFLIYGVSLFLLELSYVTPLVITLYLVIDRAASGERKSIKPMLITSVGLWGLLVAALLINRWTLGAWVGHYGAETHLKMDIIGMMSSELKFLVKHLADARYFSFNVKTFLFDKVLSNPEISFFALTGIMAVVMWYFMRMTKHRGFAHLGLFGVMASMLYVLPVANLFFYHLHVGANDRFSYVPLVFLLACLLAVLSKTPRWIWMPVMAALLLINIYLQEKTISYWTRSAEVVNALRDSFRWHDRSHVFILNSPDNLHGIVMTSIIEAPSGIEELIDFQTSKPYEGVMYDVFQYNMTTPEDGVKVEQTGPMTLKVTFNQWGNWWHRNGIGASSYENEYYKAEVLEYPYQITFKQLPENSVILYQDGKEWKEVEME